jgi:nucleoside-triphosphatase THEP1
MYAIDEIGKMELLSTKFNSSIRRLMHEATCGNIFLLATIPSAKGKPLEVVEELKAHSKAIVFTVRKTNLFQRK